MGRIQRAYEQRFREILRRVNARRLDDGVRWLLTQAARLSRREGSSAERGLAATARRLRERLAIFGHAERCDSSALNCPRFLCDAGLGGLARWLRAAGYEAGWKPRIEDSDLILEAQHRGCLLLTTDSVLMERRLLRDRILPALWVPPTLTKLEQLQFVLDELGLPCRLPRCMACGGELRPVDKASVRDRIPPRTLRWLDEYFLCGTCDKLFWHGTHWQRIQAKLPKR